MLDGISDDSLVIDLSFGRNFSADHNHSVEEKLHVEKLARFYLFNPNNNISMKYDLRPVITYKIRNIGDNESCQSYYYVFLFNRQPSTYFEKFPSFFCTQGPKDQLQKGQKEQQSVSQIWAS